MIWPGCTLIALTERELYVCLIFQEAGKYTPVALCLSNSFWRHGMTCPQCRATNPVGMRFCGHCGAPLPIFFPRCGSENPPENNFCGRARPPAGCCVQRCDGPLARGIETGEHVVLRSRGFDRARRAPRAGNLA